MKAVIKLILFFLISILFFSCEEDEDRNFQTNLSIEANQLFGTSTAWGESLYLGLLNFEDYSQIKTEELPGCPSILIESIEKRVTLTYDTANTCEQTGKVKRVGKLILQFTLISTSSNSRTLTYQNYVFRNDTISGTREFFFTTQNQVKETFSDLKITSNKNLNTVFSGTFNHNLTTLRLKLVGISSSGFISGINPTGRSFSIDITNPRQALVTCFSQNEILPISGKEKWTIDRGQSRDVIHNINYETSGSCAVTATVTLSDGRNLVVTP